MLTAQDILVSLQIAVAIMVIVVLYHFIFISVDLRKILRRLDDMTGQVEDLLLKPISMADHLMQWAIDSIEEAQGKKLKRGKKKKKR